MKKRKYLKPETEVFVIKEKLQLLQSSSLGNPSNYPNGGYPFGS